MSGGGGVRRMQGLGPAGLYRFVGVEGRTPQQSLARRLNPHLSPLQYTLLCLSNCVEIAQTWPGWP